MQVQAGAFGAVLALLGMAEAGPLDELQHARIGLVRAQLAFASSRGSDAAPLLLKAAKRLEPIDAGLARATCLDALSAAMFAGRLARPGGGALEVSRAAVAAPPPHPPHAADLLLDGLAAHFTERYSAGLPILQQARLFISARTVQYHLRQVFNKLGIISRSQLDRVLPPDPATAQPR